MRHMIVATAILVTAVSTQAQTSTARSDDPAPPLTKSVAPDPGDSPLVRAAKLAVRSRGNPSNRRVVTVTNTYGSTGSSAGRGRFAVATGPTQGPQLPASSQPQREAKAPPKTADQLKAEEVRKRQDEERLKELAAQEAQVGQEMDEPYGGDMEEDEVEAQLGRIEAERQQIQRPTPPQP
jgi:hypothetical protein